MDFAAESRNTVSVFLAALKRFYAAAIDKGYYSNPNPLTNTISLDVRALLAQMEDEEEIQRGYPRMSQAGGTTATRPPDSNRMRVTTSSQSPQPFTLLAPANTLPAKFRSTV